MNSDSSLFVLCRQTADYDPIKYHRHPRSCWRLRRSMDKRGFRKALVWNIPGKTRFWCAHPCLEYGGNEISSINDMLSMKSLELHAENLLQAISSDRNNRKEESYRPIAFLAHGYGGLICEQVCFGALLLTYEPATDWRTPQALVTALEEDGTIGRRGLNQTHGIILLGTPHFRAGLAEWAILSARSTGVPCAKTSQRQDWSSLKDDLDKISNMQSAIDDLVQRERGRHSSQRINFRACHSYRPIPKHNLVSISLPLSTSS